MQALVNRRIVITGAGSGIGRAVADRFLREGARLVLVVRKPEQVQDLEPHPNVQITVGDVSDYETSERAVEAATSVYGGLDVFVANAGIWDFHKRIEKLSPEALAAGF
ncbi:MAG: SDR family NAD(P)-dependent oxidoreductase, partial [Pseudomonadota bacterium]